VGPGKHCTGKEGGREGGREKMSIYHKAEEADHVKKEEEAEKGEREGRREGGREGRAYR